MFSLFQAFNNFDFCFFKRLFFKSSITWYSQQLGLLTILIFVSSNVLFIKSSVTYKNELYDILFQNDLVSLLYSCFPCCCCLRSYLPYRNQRFGHMTSRYASVSKSSPFGSHRSWAVSFRTYQTGSLSSRSHLSSTRRQMRISINSNKSTPSVKSSRTLVHGNNM